MKNNYDRSLANILLSEGGYTNHPADPGGPTNWGVTIYDARAYWKPGATAADVRAMPLETAKGIYREKYWNALDGDLLPAGLDYTIVDYGVNSGIRRAGVALRHGMGLSIADWHVTPDIVVSLGKRDIPMLIAEINDARLRFLQRLSTWPVFGRGWATRVASVKAISLHMAGGHVPSVPQHRADSSVPQGKGVSTIHDFFAHIFGWK